MSFVEGNKQAIGFGLCVFAAGTIAYHANGNIYSLSEKIGLSNRIDTFFQTGIKTNIVNGLFWIGSCIASPFKWGWSCVRHPIDTITNIPRRIHQVASFIWGWTFALAYRGASYMLHHYLPSLKTPLFVGLVGGGVAFGAELLDHNWSHHHAFYIKLIAMPIITSIVSYQLAYRYTSLTPSKLEVGGWGLLPSISFIAYFLMIPSN